MPSWPEARLKEIEMVVRSESMKQLANMKEKI
jgi:hypothetical protein